MFNVFDMVERYKVAAYKPTSDSEAGKPAAAVHKKVAATKKTQEALNRLGEVLKQKLKRELKERQVGDRKLNDEEVEKLMGLVDSLAADHDLNTVSDVLRHAADIYLAKVEQNPDESFDLSAMQYALKDAAVGDLGLNMKEISTLASLLNTPIDGVVTAKVEETAPQISVAKSDLGPQAETEDRTNPKLLNGEDEEGGEVGELDTSGAVPPDTMLGKALGGSVGGKSSGATAAAGSSDAATSTSETGSPGEKSSTKNHAFSVTPGKKEAVAANQLTTGIQNDPKNKAVTIDGPKVTPGEASKTESPDAGNENPMARRSLAASEKPTSSSPASAPANAEDIRAIQDLYGPGMAAGSPSDYNPAAQSILDGINQRRASEGQSPMTMQQVLGTVLPPSMAQPHHGNGGVFAYVPPPGIAMVNNFGLRCDTRGGRLACEHVRTADEFCRDLEAGGNRAQGAKQELMRLFLNQAKGIDRIGSKRVADYYQKLDSILDPSQAKTAAEMKKLDEERSNAFMLRNWLSGKNESGMVRMDACKGSGSFPLWTPSTEARYKNLKDSWCFNLKQRTQMNNDIAWKNGQWVYGDRVSQVIYGCKGKHGEMFGAKVLAELVGNPVLRAAARACNVPEASMDPLKIRGLRETAVSSKDPYKALDEIADAIESSETYPWDKAVRKGSSPTNTAELSSEIAKLTGQPTAQVNCDLTNFYMKFAHNAAVNPRFPGQVLSPLPVPTKIPAYADVNESSGPNIVLSHGGQTIGTWTAPPAPARSFDRPRRFQPGDSVEPYSSKTTSLTWRAGNAAGAQKDPGTEIVPLEHNVKALSLEEAGYKVPKVCGGPGQPRC